jgi:hypothetical protein
MQQTTNLPAADVRAPFFVRFYEPKRIGVWVMEFHDRAEAERFTEGKRCYGKPAKVETRK